MLLLSYLAESTPELNVLLSRLYLFSEKSEKSRLWSTICTSEVFHGLLECYTRDWKVSECIFLQNWKVSESESVRIGK